MVKPEKMPTPWRHPKYGSYYLKKRVPTDIKHIWQGVDPVQISLRTKDVSEAHIRISREWLKLQDRFSELRRLAARQVGLCEEVIPDLLEEWFHDNLKEDEIWRFDGTIAKADGDKAYGYSELIDQLAEGADSGNHPDFLIRSAAFFLSKKGINYDRTGFVYDKFLNELSSKYAHYLSVLSRRDEGQRVQTPTPPKAKDLMSLETLYEKFKAHKIVNEKWKDPETQDKREYGPIVREFQSVVGSKPVHQLTHEDAVKYFEHTASRTDIKLGTKKRNLTRIKTLLNFGKDQYRLPDIAGPLQIDADYNKTHISYIRFSKDDLTALFDSETYKTHSFKKASQYWLPLIGLYTGARIDEPASLLVSEIQQRDGVWCYFMSSEEANGGGKNRFAPRWVPIHPKLIEAGLLTYWETVKAEGHYRLFPEMGNAERDGCGKRATVDFTEYRRSVGVGALEGRSNKAYHSFRSTLVSELKERRIDGDMRRSLVGHAGEHGDAHDNIYDQADFQPKKALAAISRADFGLKHPGFIDTESMKKARRRYLKAD
jgi:integrase